MSASLPGVFNLQAFDDNGTPLASGRLYTYQPGTTTTKAAYMDAAASVPHTYTDDGAGGQYIALNARGELPAPLFLTASGYDIALKRSDGSTVWTRRAYAQDDYQGGDLADKTTMGKGASLVLLNQSLTPTAYSVAAKLQQVLCPLDYPWGAKGDGGVTDDSAALAAFFAAVPSGSIVELAGKEYGLYPTVTGTTSGDAIALNAIPRLYNKKGITLRNGRIFAVNPGATGSRVRFPTTLTIDGCTGIALVNAQIEAKGDGYGNADASAGLDSEGRRAFLAQNGGHALVVIRSSRVYADAACRFVRAGSTGAFYSSSSDEVHVAGYASAMSLGYAGFAGDSWCGGSSVSGFARHRLYLHGATVDANEGSYSSKACVTGEDLETYIYIDGGVYKDAYANGSAHQLGAAFSANSCHVYVNGAKVENCASIGLTTHSTGNEAKLECVGVNAKGLRTSMHIIDNVSFGTDNVKYIACNAEIVGGSTWSEPELSVPTVVANLKVSSIANVDIIGCETTGAHTFSINTNACYGGIEVSGGKHTVTDRIFDSAGWGGASSGTSRGYVMKAVKMFVFLANTAIISTAKSVATQAMNAIVNEDASSRFTYQYVDFARDVVVESNLMREFISVSALGSGLSERRFLAQRLIACYQATNTAGDNYASAVTCISANGISGSNYSVTFALLDNKKSSSGHVVDDVFTNRKFVGVLGGPTVVGTQLQVTMAMSGTTANFTPGTTYTCNFAG